MKAKYKYIDPSRTRTRLSAGFGNAWILWATTPRRAAPLSEAFLPIPFSLIDAYILRIIKNDEAFKITQSGKGTNITTMSFFGLPFLVTFTLR